VARVESIPERVIAENIIENKTPETYAMTFIVAQRKEGIYEKGNA